VIINNNILFNTGDIIYQWRTDWADFMDLTPPRSEKCRYNSFMEYYINTILYINIQVTHPHKRILRTPL